MRVAWSTLIVLVLLAPMGQVGITATPAEAEVITMPSRAPTAGAVQLRASKLRRVVRAVRQSTPQPIALPAPEIFQRAAAAVAFVDFVDRNTAISPRAPPTSPS